MSGIAGGRRGPEFYADMTDDELKSHQARDNGNLSAAMVAFDDEIAQIEAMSAKDKAVVSAMKWEKVNNG